MYVDVKISKSQKREKNLASAQFFFIKDQLFKVIL